MPKLSRALTAFLLLYLAWIAPAFPQEGPAAEFEGLVEVSEVLLDVLVTDSQGQLVLGLGPEDFEVKEKGKKVELTDVSFYTTRYLDSETEEGKAAAQEPAPQDIPWSRYFVLFFDDQRLRSGSLFSPYQEQISAARATVEWIWEGLYPSDWLAVVSHNRRLYLHQDFTQDREALSQAVAAAARGERPADEAPGRRRLPLPGSPSIARRLPPVPDLERQTRRVEDAIRLVAESTRGIVGRKGLLIFTTGFGEISSVRVGSPPVFETEQEMLEVVNDSNVAIYPIDLTRYDVTSFQESFLSRLAATTGGAFWRNQTRYGPRLRRISEDNGGYYLLSYRAEHAAGKSGFRRVRVRVPGQKVRVRARAGYLFGR